MSAPIAAGRHAGALSRTVFGIVVSSTKWLAGRAGSTLLLGFAGRLQLECLSRRAMLAPPRMWLAQIVGPLEAIAAFDSRAEYCMLSFKYVAHFGINRREYVFSRSIQCGSHQQSSLVCIVRGCSRGSPDQRWEHFERLRVGLIYE